MIIIIRALSLKKEGQKKERPKKKRKRKKGKAKRKKRKAKESLLCCHFHILVGIFYYRTWLVYSNDGRPQQCPRSS